MADILISDLEEGIPAGTDFVIYDPGGTGFYKKAQIANLPGGGGSSGTTLTAPTLSAAGIDADTIRLTIGTVANETSIEIQRSNDGTTGWSTINTAAANTTSYDDNGLAASTTRHYRVRAVGDGVTYLTSPWSSVANATTAAGGSSYEAESDAYFAVNTGLTTPEKDAVDAFIVGLKALGISKFPALYLPVWGSAADNKWNVLNPADTDGAGRLTFHGTLTHAADGLLGDGTTGYADTKLLASSIFTKGGAGAGVYMKTANTGSGAELGVVTGSNVFQLITYFTGTSAYARSWNVADGNVTGTPTNGTGFIHLTRNSLTDLRLMENTTQLDTTNTFDVTPQTVPATNSIYLMALNVDGSADLFSNGKVQVAILHTGLSFTDAQTLSNLVNDLITDLGI
jgi:hypothetical protein